MLEAKNISLTFSRKEILKDISFSLPLTQHMLILGPSGCGKTSLLSVLGGIQTPHSGEVMFGDVNLYHLKQAERDAFRGKNIGIVFQTFHLIPHLTLYQNLQLVKTFGSDIKVEEKIDHHLERLGLASKSHMKVSTLSIGERQRLGVARAVIGTPKWILCDEPTSSLDDGHCKEMLTLLKTEATNCGASLIIVTHDKRVQTFFDDCQILELGKMS